MFERFTDRARRVTVLAQDEARRLGHAYVGTEHLLLAVAREGTGVGARTLEGLGFTLDEVRRRVEDMAGRGDSQQQGRLPFTAQAKRVLELSLREALQMGCNYIGSEHILLGLVHEGEGVAARVLTGLGTDLDHVRQQAIEARQGHQRGGPVRAVRMPARPDKKGRRTRLLLGEFGARLDALDQRLTALEQRVGIGPDLGDLETRITRVRRPRRWPLTARSSRTRPCCAMTRRNCWRKWPDGGRNGRSGSPACPRSAPRSPAFVIFSGSTELTLRTALLNSDREVGLDLLQAVPGQGQVRLCAVKGQVEEQPVFMPGIPEEPDQVILLVQGDEDVLDGVVDVQGLDRPHLGPDDLGVSGRRHLKVQVLAAAEGAQRHAAAPVD
jgi:hypothetical protein